ncbi:MAG TPA: serine hydrolase domain-containing protein [Ramlibacter sp.]|nr:serine hydrolase domain-containing protein [Ramlibacter sp.]
MVHTARRFAFLVVFVLALAGCASSSLQMASTPEEVRLSSQRLKEFSAAMQAKVDAGELPGAVILVARDGKVAYVDAVGYRDREAKAPMPKDALFSLMSMTKPITTAAAMILVEEGKLKLSDPISKYLPEYRQLQVGVERPGADGKPMLATEPARAQITVLDLMRHTSGITYGPFGKSLVKDAYNAADLWNLGQSTGEFAIKVSKLPLQYQPGTQWDYGMSTDVLGRVVEVAAATPLDQFVTSRILKPLKMNDTAYSVEPGSVGRVAEPQVIASTGKRPQFLSFVQKPKWIGGGHGLISSAQDYVRFCQMILNGGTLDGARILSKESVDLMAANHLTAATARPIPVPGNILAPSHENGQGFGLGFAVRTSQGTNNIPGSIGDLSWGGAYGTFFWIDPKERLVAILMTQSPANVNQPLRRVAREHVYRALR